MVIFLSLMVEEFFCLRMLQPRETAPQLTQSSVQPTLSPLPPLAMLLKLMVPLVFLMIQTLIHYSLLTLVILEFLFFQVPPLLPMVQLQLLKLDKLI